MVEKWRPDFQGMGHTHAVHLAQDIVRQKILEIEPQSSFNFRTALDRIKQLRHSSVLGPQEKRILFLFRKRSGPEYMCLLRAHERALNKPLQLVFETDF